MKIKKLQNTIEKTKIKLIDRAKKKGLYENFGQNEVRELKDKFVDISSYTDEMNKIRSLINNFDNWASNVNDNDLK